MNSIHEYIFNDLKDLFIGKLNTTKENSNYYDIIDSPSCKIKDSNLIMIPKLIINKSNKRNNFNELLEIAYNKLKLNKKYNELNNNIYHEIFYFYKAKNTNNLTTKIYTIFPNINFEFKQIKNLSFSNTNLNKYLISSKFKLPEKENNKNDKEENDEYINGFFTMSQNHRLIALKDDLKECGGDINKSQSLKEIIVGIWLNLKNEKPPPKKADLDFLFDKYKFLIYKECFRFIQLSNNIETIYSPSPEENIFLLVIFYKGMQCHYEVKIGSNNDEKKIYNSGNKNIMKENNWLISKCKYELDEQKLKIPFDYDIKIEINNGTISTMTDFLNKKNKNKNNIKKNEMEKETIKENKNNQKIIFKDIINNNNNNMIKEIKNNNDENNNNNIINNTSSDVFDLSDCEGDSSYGGYNYPLAIPNMNKNYSNNGLIKNNQNKNEQNILYKKQQHETSRASTNAHSNKPSLSSSKNSGKNNISNVENINQINEEESNINENENSFELINQYTCSIMKNSESIKKLQNQVNKLEKSIMEIIEQLEMDKKEKNKKRKKEKKEKKNKNMNVENINCNNHDISNIGDVSINVPRIIYKELSMTKDDL